MRGKAQEAGALGDTIGVLNVAVQARRAGRDIRARPRHGRAAAADARRRKRAECVDASSPQHCERPSRSRASRERYVRCRNASRVCGVARSRRRVAVAGRRLRGDATASRLIGEQPPLSAIDNPTTKPGYKPVQMPMPTPQPATYNPNSLWRNGSRAFFNDQRAHQVGDILTVKVNITDKANFENETQRSRTNKEDSGDHQFHRQPTPSPIRPTAILPGRISDRRRHVLERRQGLGQPPGSVADQRRRGGDAGAAERQPGDRGQAGNPRQLRNSRTDRRRHRAAGGHPERQHHRLSKIAQARIAYGGRGQITDVQQPRYGQQVLDVVLPF